MPRHLRDTMRDLTAQLDHMEECVGELRHAAESWPTGSQAFSAVGRLGQIVGEIDEALTAIGRELNRSATVSGADEDEPITFHNMPTREEVLPTEVERSKATTRVDRKGAYSVHDAATRLARRDEGDLT